MSRRNGTSIASPRRIIENEFRAGLRAQATSFSEIFRELDPVAVLVVDVEQADVAVELEDDADLDFSCAQALGFTLHVGDRDHGNAALLVRLPFAQIHLGISVTEEGPA